jgi:Cu(I)/Ag(I) efflux system membrane fusion protein
MKKIIITATIGLFIGLSIGWFLFHAVTLTGSAEKSKILYYRDPMNPQITFPLPKKSSDGMDFVAVYAEQPETRDQRKIAYYQDPMHPWYTSDKPGKAPDCGMDLVPVYEGDSDVRGIKIGPVIIQNIGIKTEIIRKRGMSKTIRTNGKIDYDERKVYAVNTKISGWVEKLYVNYSGQVVHQGDPLMDLYSPELVTTQQEYLQAIRYRARLAGSDNQEVKKSAEDLVQSAKRRLLYWDIPESEITALERRDTPKKSMTIISPVNGVVIDKTVWPGQNILPGSTLYKVADLSTLWILADIYEYELPWVQLGQKAEIESAYLPGHSFNGTVTYIYPYLNTETRTVRVRIEIDNTPALQFKPEMYVTVKLISPLTIDAVAVPEQAVIHSGERNIIVISLGGGYFDSREVKLGVTADGYTQIIEGAREGQVVVTSSQFLIDSESNLKAAITSISGHENRDMTKPMAEPKTGNVEQQQAGDGQTHEVYTCVMHPQIRSDQPGDCPICGMKLVPVMADSSKTKHHQR